MIDDGEVFDAQFCKHISKLFDIFYSAPTPSPFPRWEGGTMQQSCIQGMGE